MGRVTPHTTNQVTRKPQIASFPKRNNTSKREKRPGPPENHPSKHQGAIAQLGERLICIQEVVGSIPSGSTIRLAALARVAG